MPAAHAERLRLAALRAYAVLDDEPLPELDGLCALAAHVTGAQVASVNLVGVAQQWQAAGHGASLPPLPLEESMCRLVVEEGQPVHTGDASRDPRWAGNPYVDGRRGRVRTYAAAPLRDPEGSVLGSLCVLDDRPRGLTPEQLHALGLLADQAVALLEGRRRAAQLRAAVAELDRLAHVDGLTGLVNRTAAVRAVDRVCATGGWGLLFVDVDDFKAVNDLHGHDVGDVALREVAARLRAGLRPHDLLARWAGDEFVALLADVHTDGQVHEVVARLHALVAQPFEVAGRPVALAVSIGGVVVPAGSEGTAALREADAAMYAAKRAATGG